MGIGDVQGIAGLLRDQEYILLILIALAFVLFLFVRRWWMAFASRVDRRLDQIDVIHRLTLELAELSELDLAKHPEITSHQDIIRKLDELAGFFKGGAWVSHNDLLDRMTVAHAKLNERLDDWYNEVEGRCTIANCPHRTIIEAVEKEMAAELHRQAEAMNQIVKDNKEIGNELVAFAGSLLEVIAKRNGAHHGAPGSNS